MSAMRSSTIGRSPEMPMGQSPGCPPAPRRMVSEDGPQRRSGIAAGGRRDAGTGRPRPDRCRGGEAAPAPGSRPAWPPARTRWRRDACRPGRAPPRGMSATTVQKAMRTIAPGATRTRRRRAKIGSSTVPTVLESGRPSITAIGRRMPWPRPRKRARSVSTSGLPTASPSTTARCAAQISGSAGDAPPPRRQDGALVGEILGRDEQLQEGRMRDVVGLRRQHQLGVGRHVDLARPVAGIRDRDAADLGVVFGRDEHLQRRRERPVAAG